MRSTTRRGSVGGRPGAALAGLAGRLEVLTQEAYELDARNQPLPPRRLDGVQSGDDAAVDGGDADAERLGRLLAAVGEPLSLDHLPQLARRRRDQLRLGTVMT